MTGILLLVSLFSFVDCFAGDYNTNPKIRINYLSQNSGKKMKILFLDLQLTDNICIWLMSSSSYVYEIPPVYDVHE